VIAICPVCGFHNDLTETLHGSNIFCYVCGKNPDNSLKKNACGSEFDVLGTLPNLPAAKLTSERFEIGRAFCTKLWNSARFVFMNIEGTGLDDWNQDDLKLEDRWILASLSSTIRAVSAGLKEYNPSNALNAVRDFFWSFLCDWYLELIKSRLSQLEDRSGKVARQVIAFCLDMVLKMLHPFIPYITEHLWQILGTYVPVRGLGQLVKLTESKYLIQAAWPSPLPEFEDDSVKETFSFFQEITRTIRELRAARNIPPKQELVITIKPQSKRQNILETHSYIIMKLARIKEIIVDSAAKRPAGAASTIVNECEIFIHNVIDDAAEKKKLVESLANAEKEILACENKLKNSDFVSRAPRDIVNKQMEKLEELRKNREALATTIKAMEM